MGCCRIHNLLSLCRMSCWQFLENPIQPLYLDQPYFPASYHSISKRKLPNKDNKSNQLGWYLVIIYYSDKFSSNTIQYLSHALQLWCVIVPWSINNDIWDIQSPWFKTLVLSKLKLFICLKYQPIGSTNLPVQSQLAVKHRLAYNSASSHWWYFR